MNHRFLAVALVLLLCGGCVGYYYRDPYSPYYSYYNYPYYPSTYGPYYYPYYRPPAFYYSPGWMFWYPSFIFGYSYRGYHGYRGSYHHGGRH